MSMTAEEKPDRWHIIWDMCWEFINDPADCNELSTNIDSFFEAQLAPKPDREKIARIIGEDYHDDRDWDEYTKEAQQIFYKLADRIIALGE